MLGIDDTVSLEHHEARDKTLDLYLSHEFMLSNGIPILEQLVHLDDLRTPRFFLMAVPARMGGLESFPVRAIAIELEG
jgi:kynurenine formamidase